MEAAAGRVLSEAAAAVNDAHNDTLADHGDHEEHQQTAILGKFLSDKIFMKILNFLPVYVYFMNLLC
jgi:hypothetical protein